VARRALLVAVALVALLATAADAKRVDGTPRADVLRGTNRADVLSGRGGADLIDGRGGRDRLLGGTGDDRVQAFDGARDQIVCGAGRDLAAADSADVVRSDCELVSRQISHDPFRSGPAQHATAVEPHAAANGTTVIAVFQVGRFQDGGAEAIGWASSRNAGHTWSTGLLPGLTSAAVSGSFARASDPVVAYDSLHSVWLASTLAITPGQRSALAISRSVDGRSWSTPVLADSSTGGLAYDKQWLVCDNGVASPFRGRCYLSYSDLSTERISTRFSTDGGVTWSAPVPGPNDAGHEAILGRYAPGVQPVVRPNGEVVIVYYDERRISALRSQDGGESYSGPFLVGQSTFSDAPGLRAAPLPTAAVDEGGTVYAAWADCGARTGCRANDVVISSSGDGVAWSTPRTVVPGSGDRLFPSLAADTAGKAAVTYYVRSGSRLGVRLVASADGGSSWTKPARLDAEPVRLSWVAEAGGAMLGDYFATVFADGHPVGVFSLAAQPRARLNQGIFAAVLP
jgi:RTX calcium-binding nonapeptide repeat (4 copies)